MQMQREFNNNNAKKTILLFKQIQNNRKYCSQKYGKGQAMSKQYKQGKTIEKS